MRKSLRLERESGPSLGPLFSHLGVEKSGEGSIVRSEVVMSESTYVEKLKRCKPLFECADGSYDLIGAIEYAQERFGLTPRLAETVAREALGFGDEE